MENVEKPGPPEAELEWIQLRQDFGDLMPETTKEKMLRKIKENPLVPLGLYIIT